MALPAPKPYTASSLRFALTLGLGGMAVIFLIATIDALRLLNTMRAENRILRAAALERSNHLTSIRSCILLTQTYLGEYLVDSDRAKSQGYAAKVGDTWARFHTKLSTTNAP